MDQQPRHARPAARRLAWSAGLALALVGTAVVLPGAVGAREGAAPDVYVARTAAAAATAADGGSGGPAATDAATGTATATGTGTDPELLPHDHAADDDLDGAPDDGHGHDHGDPATKNAVSRAGEAAGTEDPTTAAQARRAAAAVAAGRRTPDPVLVDVPLRDPRRAVPEDRFAMAGGCYTVGGAPVRFQATDLGQYALWTADRQFLTPDGPATTPSDAAEWTATRVGPGRYRLAAPGGSRVEQLRTTTGCAAYPEVQVGVRGLPHGGATSFQEVRGYADLHTHGMAYEFLGGEAHCGKPWDRFGAPYALVDCEDHTLTGGNGAALEALLSGEPTHDPVGWPTFRDWPAPESLTHEGTYWKWMERSWRGGLRLFVNLLVENGQLCQAYPLKRNSCDEMDSVRLQAQRMREFERYVDAQYGGPGEGWYRIVTSPWQARRVINQGKLAVVMGIETSLPFGCTFTKVPVAGDVAACDTASIDRQLDEVHRLGVRQMELVNKFDNALSGVAGDSGEVGVVINGANFNETGTFWDMRKCTPADGESADRTQLAAPDISAGQQDALFGAVAQLAGTLDLSALPLYPTPLHCNERGLTELGEHLVDAMADKRMLIDPDHMSVKARNQLLDRMEARRYPGVMSSHSWSTPDAYPRIYRAGGAIAPYAGDSTGFVAKWRRHLGWADPRYFFGMSYGADINGLGAQGNPRGDVPNKVTYPFRGIGGITLTRQRSGERVHDINTDGVAHYGLYPDWIEDLRQVAGADGDAIVEDMTRGPEAYLQTWERAEGVRPDSCRNPGLRRSVRAFERAVRDGLASRAVLEAVGQPFVRVGREYRYCAEAPGRPRVALTVELSRAGRVVDVRRGWGR